MQTLLDKIWAGHAIAELAGHTLLYVDRHFVHEGSRASFDQLARAGRTVRRPAQTFAIADHFVPTAATRRFVSADSEAAYRALRDNASREGVSYFGMGDPSHGIVHVVAPELGLVQPGTIVMCGDSHTSTLGAFGALAFGIGASEMEHVLATQTLWLQKPLAMRVELAGALAPGVHAKDLILHVIATIGAAGAVGHVVELAGPAIAALSMEQRMTLCNMAVEAGARTGIIAPDETTFRYLEARRFSPRGDHWAAQLEHGSRLRSDDGARFDRRVELRADAVAPMVTWGTNPEQAAPVTATVPDPAAIAEPGKRALAEAALAYMGLAAGQALADVRIDKVFIGSCTNARIEDLRAAAAVLRGRRVAVPGLVVPGSATVKREAEAEGLDRVFVEAGLEWREPGCSMCIAVNGDVLAPGERCASTSNRNFQGRQGKGARTHLVSPAMAAAAAVAGRLADVRDLLA